MLRHGIFVVVAGLFLLTAAVVNLSPRSSIVSSNLAACPVVIDGYQGTDVDVEKFVLEELEPSDLLYRTYRSGENPRDLLWLVVSFFENARYGAHDPEVCYRSQGWRIDPRPSRALHRANGEPLPANVFQVSRRGQERLVMYWWYISEEQATGDHRSFMNSMAWQGILRGSTYGSFVRVSTPAWPDEEAALIRLDRFGQHLLHELPKLYSDSEVE
jgi:EpsI family protein